jgi:cytochrome c554/c'-like protein
MIVRIRIIQVLASLLIGAGFVWSSDTTLSPVGAQKENALSDWRPLQRATAIRFVGSAVCADCHRDRAATQFASPMAHALELATDCEILNKRGRMTFREDRYSYQIVRDGARSLYSVSDGSKTITEPILYGFGQGRGGQTYVFRHDGAIYEARVSYYRATNDLDFTIGQPRTVPASVEDALGRRISQTEAVECFGCHAPSAVNGADLQLDKLVPGVTCETCHGPGEKHVAAVKSGEFRSLQIFNPRGLDSNSLSQEFCGTCHRGFDQVMHMPSQGGFQNLRFQPYRIFNSKGHNRLDARVSCIACHDPHEQVKRDDSFYDSKCVVCHVAIRGPEQTKSQPPRTCPVGKEHCANCHMPKIEIPGTHTKFTDHWIRVVKLNDPIPR